MKLKKKKGKNDFSLELRRQFAHALGIFTVPVIFYFGKFWSLLLLGAIAIFFFILAAYKLEKQKRGKNFLLEEFAAIENFFEERIYKNFERKESFPMKGAILFYLGAFLTLLFFPEKIAAASIAVLAIGDSASTLIGKKFGRHKISGNKTLEGSLGFFIFSFLILLFFVSPERAIFAALISAFAESVEQIDDNLSVPLAVAAALTIF